MFNLNQTLNNPLIKCIPILRSVYVKYFALVIFQQATYLLQALEGLDQGVVAEVLLSMELVPTGDEDVVRVCFFVWLALFGAQFEHFECHSDYLMANEVEDLFDALWQQVVLLIIILNDDRLRGL